MVAISQANLEYINRQQKKPVSKVTNPASAKMVVSAQDEIDLSKCQSFEEVNKNIDDWMDYYNNDRYQWQLAKLSPNQFYRYVTTGEYPLPGNPPAGGVPRGSAP